MADGVVTPADFDAADGLADWRIMGDGMCAFFATAAPEIGGAFAAAVTALPGAQRHGPDLDLRADGVFARLLTFSPDSFGFDADDLAMARAISATAAERGLRPDPTQLQTVQVTIDALDLDAVKPFWRAVLGYADRADSPEDLIDPRWRGATIWFQQLDAPRPQRNCVHLDIWVPKEDAAARVAAAVAAGGKVRSDKGAPTWWVLADAEGNEACVSSIEGRD